MSMLPANDDPEPNQEADNKAKAMKEQLRKDVASWSAARPEPSTALTAEPSVPAAKQLAPQPTAKAKRSKPAAPQPKPAPVRNKPFSMSYDGVTNAEHIANMIARGAR